MLNTVLNTRRRLCGSAVVLTLTQGLIGTAAPGQTLINLPANAAAASVGTTAPPNVINLGVGESLAGFFNAKPGTVINIFGGGVGGASSTPMDSVVNLSAGGVGTDFTLGGVLNFSGGTLGNGFRASGTSTVNIFGTSFTLNGNPIESLVLNQPFTLNSPNSTLGGDLADGTSFLFSNDDVFDPNATVTLTVIPEPASLACLSLVGVLLLPRRHTKR